MKHPILKRKPNRKDDPLYGLNRRVENGGAIIDHKPPLKRRPVAVEK